MLYTLYIKYCIKNKIKAYSKDEFIKLITKSNDKFIFMLKKKIINLLDDENKTIKEYSKIYFNEYKLINCPNILCNNYINIKDIKASNIECPHCHIIVCTSCFEISHPGQTCDSINDNFIKLLGYKKCPKCNTIIEKNEGCLDMGCENCGTRFNWETREIQMINTNETLNKQRDKYNKIRENYSNRILIQKYIRSDYPYINLKCGDILDSATIKDCFNIFLSNLSESIESKIELFINFFHNVGYLYKYNNTIDKIIVNIIDNNYINNNINKYDEINKSLCLKYIEYHKYNKKVEMLLYNFNIAFIHYFINIIIINKLIKKLRDFEYDMHKKGIYAFIDINATLSSNIIKEEYEYVRYSILNEEIKGNKERNKLHKLKFDEEYNEKLKEDIISIYIYDDYIDGMEVLVNNYLDELKSFMKEQMEFLDLEYYQSNGLIDAINTIDFFNK